MALTSAALTQMPMTRDDTINVVTTRPNNRATNLLRAINDLATSLKAVQAHHIPLIDISGYHDQRFFERLDSAVADLGNNSDKYHGVIFISGNAVDWAQRSLPNDLWQSIISNPLFAIGEQTASVLQTEIAHAKTNTERSLTAKQVTYPEQMNSEGLLNLPQLQQLQGQQWLIVKGKGGREKLKAGLQQAGAKVQELSVYQRQLPDSSTKKHLLELQQSRPIWLISSIQALENLSQMLNDQTQDCRIIISSDRIAEQASQMGFTIIAQANDASDQQLVQCLAEYIGKQL